MLTSSSGVSLRMFEAADFPALFDINCAGVPGVSEESRSSFAHIVSLSTCIVACEGGHVLGFVNLVEPGTEAYESPNLRWCEAYGAAKAVSQIYVDRIAIHEDARGRGLGEALYRECFSRYADRDVITAEVNTLPDNPGSHRFHQRLEFERVGEQVFKPGEKAVAYYARALRSA